MTAITCRWRKLHGSMLTLSTQPWQWMQCSWPCRAWARQSWKQTPHGLLQGRYEHTCLTASQAADADGPVMWLCMTVHGLLGLLQGRCSRGFGHAQLSLAMQL